MPIQSIDLISNHLHVDDSDEETVSRNTASKPQFPPEGTNQTAAMMMLRRLCEKSAPYNGVNGKEDAITALANDAEFCHASRQVWDHAFDAIKSIIRLDGNNSACKDFLTNFDGVLRPIDTAFTKQIKSVMPEHPAARVGDFNENISYCMLTKRRLNPLGTGSRRSRDAAHSSMEDYLENELRSAVGNGDAVSWQGSFLKTEHVCPQPAHVDFKWEVLSQEQGNLFIGFFPLTPEGMFLQLWNNADSELPEKGTIVFIPHGKMLLVPSSTVHGGGFRTNNAGNPRFHLYVSTSGRPLPEHQQNKYTEEHDRSKELCDRLTDSPHMDMLLDTLFA